MYNAGPYIAKCLDSIIAEFSDEKGYEVIVVDNGSTDDGAEIVKGYAARHDNLRLLRQDNAGPGAARNKGLECSKEEYVWFIDADDWIEQGCVAKICSALADAAGNGAPLDILQFGMVNYLHDGKTVDSIFKYDFEGMFSGEQLLVKMDEKLKMCVPLCVFRREFLVSNNLLFTAGILHEDAEFMPKATWFAKRIQICKDTFYQRLLHENSITHSKDSKRVDNILYVLGSLHEFVASRISSKDSCDRAFCSIISNIINYGCRIAGEISDESLSRYNAALASLPWVTKTLTSSTKLKYRFEGWLLRLFPGRLTDIHKVLMKLK